MNFDKIEKYYLYEVCELTKRSVFEGLGEEKGRENEVVFCKLFFFSWFFLIFGGKRMVNWLEGYS